MTRHQERMRTYGLTPQDYDEMLDQQDRRCAICRTEPSARRLAVDHDHRTGAVRGLLCTRCNMALGYLQDSLANAEALTAYLIDHGADGDLSCLPDYCARCERLGARRADVIYTPHHAMHEGTSGLRAYYRCPREHEWTCGWSVDLLPASHPVRPDRHRVERAARVSDGIAGLAIDPWAQTA